MSLRQFSRMLPPLKPWANYIFRELPCEYWSIDSASPKVAHPLCRKARIVCRNENVLVQYWCDRQNPIAKPYLKVFLKSLEVNNRSRLKQRLKSATAFTKYYSDVQHSLVVRSNIKHYSSTSIAKTIDFHYTCGDKFAQKRVLLVVRYPSSKSDICPTFPKWQHSWKWSQDSIKEVS